MSVYKRGNTYWVKFNSDGKTVRRSANTSSKRAAQAFEKDLKEQFKVLKETGYGAYRVNTYTYADALLRWVQAEAPESMYSHIRSTRLYLDRVPLEKILPAVSAMRDDMLQKGLSPLTINRKLSVVKRVLNLAYEDWHWIKEPMAKKIRKLSEKGSAREIYLSVDEVKQLANAVNNPEARKVILIAAYTGLRKSELLRLTEKDWKPPYLYISSKSKSKKPRRVPVIEELHPLVTLPFDVGYDAIRYNFDKAREVIGRPELWFHDLRHTFASWLAENPQIPLSLVRDLLGHSSLSVTNRYAHLRDENYDLLEQTLGRSKPDKMQNSDTK